MRVNDWKKYDYSRRTMDNVVIPAFERSGIPLSESANLKNCGRFVHTCDCLNCNTKHYAGFNRCKSRWCINCNHLRGLAFIARLYPIFEDWLAQGNYINLVNYTVKDLPFGQLKKGVEGLNESFRALYNEPCHRKEWKRRFNGGLRSLEVKIGANSAIWHMHMHSIVLKDNHEKDYTYLRDRWKAVTRSKLGHEGSVWLKGVEGNKQAILSAICETLKYIVKPEFGLYDSEVYLYEAWHTLKGKRQVNTWGNLRGIPKLAELDTENYTEKKLTEFICQLCGCTEAELNANLYARVKDSLLLDIIPQKKEADKNDLSC